MNHLKSRASSISKILFLDVTYMSPCRAISDVNLDFFALLKNFSLSLHFSNLNIYLGAQKGEIYFLFEFLFGIKRLAIFCLERLESCSTRGSKPIIFQLQIKPGISRKTLTNATF